MPDCLLVIEDKKMKKRLFVFESNPDFADNSRGFWEYLKDNNNIDTFWCVRNEKMYQRMKENGIQCALFGTDIANEMIDKADCFITSSFEFAYHKKKNQIHVSAWHGFPLKLIGYFDTASSSVDFLNLKVITAQSDIITATSRTCQLNMSGMLSVDPNKVKITGFPRNDLIGIENGRENLKKLIDVHPDSRFIFYLPTMRKGLKDEGKQFEENIFNYSDYDVKELDAFLKKNNAYIVSKFHFADQEYFQKNDFKVPKRMILLDTESLNEQLMTIYHIMNAFDVLVTDYSSVYVDYLLLNRPIIFSCPDIEEYKKDRGFVVEDPSLLMPGKMIQSQASLIESLEQIFHGEDIYKEKRKSMLGYFHKYLDSLSSQRLLDEINFKLNDNSYDFDKKLGKAYLPGNSNLYNYSMELNTEIYLDKGKGLNEDDKLYINKNIIENGERLVYELSQLDDVQYIRFDPDVNGHWILKDIEIRCKDELLPFNIFNGIQNNNMVYFLGFDPQIHIDFKDNNVDNLKISFNIIDTSQSNEFVTYLLNELQQENVKFKNELESIKNSRSYKATQKMKKIIKR